MYLSVRNSLAGVVLLSLLALSGCGHPGANSTSAGSLASRLDAHLVILDKNGTFKPYDGSLKDIKYFAFYHSAGWCAPCRLFTPQLVKFYTDFKPSHPDFELIYVSHDPGTTDMLAYMKSDTAPWPAVRFDDIEATKLDDMDSSGNLPNLILTDANGNILSNNFQDDNFVKPEKVLDDIKRLVH